MLISLSLSKWATRNYKSQKQNITNKYGTFSICTHDDILKLMDKSKNKNTTKATAACRNLYHIWAKPRGEVLELAKVETKKQKTTVKIISLILYVQWNPRKKDIFLNVAIRIRFVSRESLLPQKLFWKEKYKLFPKMEKEGGQIKAVA